MTAITMQQRLERQASLNLSLPSSVTIVGCGGVGSWTALFLALAGVPRLLLWDHDEVSEHNLNRLPFGSGSLGQNKAAALQNLILGLHDGCAPFAIGLAWTPERMDGIKPSDGLNWIVAATDTWASRKEIYAWANENHMRYIECSAEGEWGGCTDSPPFFSTPDEANPGYASVPVHVGPCVVAAAMTCYHILHNCPAPFNYRLGWTDGMLEFQDLELSGATASEFETNSKGGPQ